MAHIKANYHTLTLTTLMDCSSKQKHMSDSQKVVLKRDMKNRQVLVISQCLLAKKAIFTNMTPKLNAWVKIC